MHQKKKPLKLDDIKQIATGPLGLSLIEYYDKTLHELTIEVEGYNARQEENINLIRPIYALLYNVNAPKGKTKTAKQLWPLPSETIETEFDKRIKELQTITAMKAFAKK